MTAASMQMLTEFGPEPCERLWRGLGNGPLSQPETSKVLDKTAALQPHPDRRDSPHGLNADEHEHSEPSRLGIQVGNYRICEKLGAGGFGNVYRGLDEMLGREVALKLLRPELTSDPTFVERFRREAQILAKLDFPNIAGVYALLERGDALYMVMEYIRGKPLDRVIRQLGAMPVQQALRVFQQVLQGIAYAHRNGIVHRDIKPANIMLAADGRVKILDFGIAHVLGSAHLTLTGQIGGTVAYMSPEQILGEEVDSRADIYSLGVVLYMLLTGHQPFAGKSNYELMKSQIECSPPPLCAFGAAVPTHLEAALMRALQKRPCDRFQSAEEFSRAVGQGTGESIVCKSEDEVPARAPRNTVGDAQAASDREQVQRCSPQEPAVEAPVDHEQTKLAPVGPRSTPPHGPDGEPPESLLAALVRLVRAHAGSRLLPVTLCALSVSIGGLVTLSPPVNHDASVTPAVNAAPVVSTDPQSPRRAAGEVVQSSLPAGALRDAAGAPGARDMAHASPVKEPLKTLLTILPLRPDQQEAAGTGTASYPAEEALSPARRYVFERGEVIDLLVIPNQDAYIYCYLQDENRKIRRFYPNRFSTRALVKAAAPLRIPGTMGFQIVANEVGASESVACFATARNVSAALPNVVLGKDFDELPVSSLAEVRGAFGKAAGQALVEAHLEVEVR